MPKIIDCGLVRIQVKLVDKTTMREETDCDADDGTPEGAWVDEDDTIYLGRWMSAKRKREVLFHELQHAMIDYREHVGNAHETE